MSQRLEERGDIRDVEDGGSQGTMFHRFYDSLL